MEEQKTYNSNLLKGTGLIQEMLVLIQEYNGESRKDFQDRIINEGILAKSTEKRAIDIVRNVFSVRFLVYELNVASLLHEMRDHYTSMDVMIQLFYIYTCRANPILEDFIKDIYFPYSNKGYQKLQADDPKKFIRDAISDGRIVKPWAQSTINKVSEHIIATLIDFRLIERNKNILPIQILDLSANYLAHELHFRGVADNEIWVHEDWKLFGLEPNEVIEVLEKLSYQGSFIFQFSGQILQLSWKNQTMKEFIANECR